MNVTPLFGSSAESSRDRSVRLALAPGNARSGTLDGAWWPHSGDPLPEFTALVLAVGAALGRVFRIELNQVGWYEPPERIIVHGQVIRLAGYRRLAALRTGGPADTNTIKVFCAGRDPLELLVVPASAPTASAQAAMAAASDPSSRAGATELLTEYGLTTQTRTPSPWHPSRQARIDPGEPSDV